MFFKWRQPKREREALSEDHAECIKRTLYHTHLPKLVEAGVIIYDSNSETVSYQHPPLVEKWAEQARKYELN